MRKLLGRRLTAGRSDLPKELLGLALGLLRGEALERMDRTRFAGSSARVGVGALSNARPYAFRWLATFRLPPLTQAEDTDGATDEAIKPATDAAKKMSPNNRDVKQILEENDRAGAREKGVVQAAVDARTPAAFADWTPQGPALHDVWSSREKVVPGEARVVLERN